MRMQQPAVSAAAQKVSFSASACLLRLFEISLANEIVFFSFHAVKPRLGCNDIRVSAAAPTNAKKVNFSPFASFVCSY